MANWLNNLKPKIGVFMLLAGIPACGIIYGNTEDLSSSILLTIVYELVVVFLGFAGKVWQKLESRWVERIVDWIDLTAQALFSGYKNKYFEYITYQHRVFDMKGLNTQGPYNLELEKIYVQLGVDPTPTHEATPNPVGMLPKGLRSGSHFIWEYLTNEHTHRKNYAILGAPGSGKTTLLKHLALTLASSKRERQKNGAPDLLPILLFIREHASVIKDQQTLSLAQLIRSQFADRQAPLPPPGWLEKQIEQGKCLIMLDGLDEVADISTRKAVVNWVDQCISSYGKNRFIVSSRPFGYRSSPLSNVTVLQIRPFSLKQQEQFVFSWYLANEIMSSQKDDPGVREDARRGAFDLLKRIRLSNAISALAVNPLLLTMIATVHRYRSSLPGRRVELYAEICDVFLGKRQQARGLQIEMTPAKKITVLSHVACYMMFKRIREVGRTDATQIINPPLASVSPQTTAIQFLEDVENSSGLLIELESGRYSFSHLTFQEYLASLFIVEARLERELIKHVADPWWRETIRLYCAQTNASNVIVACLQSSDVNAFTLAAECLDEAHEVNPNTRVYYQEVMEKGVDDPDPERRRLIATVMLKRRTR